jgi:hypothetical protein
MNYRINKEKANQKWLILFRYAELKWFNSIFGEHIYTEGWYLNNSFVDHMDVCLTNDSSITLETAKELAKEYGWIFNESDEVIDFDINKLTRNNYLLTANDLGLL